MDVFISTCSFLKLTFHPRQSSLEFFWKVSPFCNFTTLSTTKTKAKQSTKKITAKQHSTFFTDYEFAKWIRREAQMVGLRYATQKTKFSVRDLLSKCDQIRSFLRTWPHLLKKSLMDNFIFCAAIDRYCYSWSKMKTTALREQKKSVISNT